jgi:hypothetical protein
MRMRWGLGAAAITLDRMSVPAVHHDEPVLLG